MIIVADSSALIALATCSGLNLLTQLYEQVSVPEAVYVEVTETGKPTSEQLAAFLQNRVQEVEFGRFVLTTNTLGQGELEAMALYKQLAADALLIDDRRARKIAEANKINCVGALGILLLAKTKGQITEIAPYLERLRQSPIYYSEGLFNQVLKLAGELP